MSVRAKPKTTSEKASMRDIEVPRRRKPSRAMYSWIACILDRLSELDSAENASGQREDRAQQAEDAVHGDADDAEWQREQPDKGVKHQHDKRCRPVEDKKNEEE